MNETYFAIRTIRKGAVKVHGQLFCPSEQFLKYDGRLDGMRYAFARYKEYDGKYRPLLYLWGTEKAYKSQATMDWPGPDCVDGYFTWAWWHPSPCERGSHD